jgi:PAS domain S-box-containing protein
LDLAQLQSAAIMPAAAFALGVVTTLLIRRRGGRLDHRSSHLTPTDPDVDPPLRRFYEMAREGLIRIEFHPPVNLQADLGDVVSAIRRNGRIAECSEAAAKMRGFTSAREVQGLSIDRLLVEGDAENQAFLESFVRQGCRIEDAVSHGWRRDGSVGNFLNNVFGEVRDGHLVSGLVTQIDLTERIVAEEALRQSEQLQRETLAAASMGTWRWDLHTDHVHWSDECYAFFGQCRETFGGTFDAVVELVHPADRKSWKAEIEATMAGRCGDYRCEFRAIWPDGSIHWLEARGRLARDASGTPASMSGTVMDIEVRKQAELSLRQSEERFQSLAGAAFESIAITEGGRFLDCNDCFVATFGYSREELFGREVMLVVHPDDQPMVRANIRERFCGPYEHRAVLRDGTVIIVEVQARDLPFGTRKGRVTSLRDVTSRRKHEATLLRIAEGVSATTGAAFLRSLVQSLALVLRADFAFVGELGEGEPSRVNTLAHCVDGQFSENFCYQLEGTPCADVFTGGQCVHNEFVQQAYPNDRMLADMGVEGYVGAPLRDHDGHTFGILVVMFRARIEEPTLVESTLRIFAARAAAELARRNVEEALTQSEARLRATVDNTPHVAVQWYDRRGTVLFWNPASESFYGWSSADAIGLTLDRLIASPDANADFLSQLARVEATGETVGPVEVVFHRRDGAEIVCVSTIFRIPTATDQYSFVRMDVDVTARRRAELRHEELAMHLLDSQESERRRLAAELHDSLGQSLSMIRNRTHLARNHEARPAVDTELVAIERLVVDAIAEVRGLAQNLRPLHIEQLGLTGSLAELLIEVQQATSVRIEHHLEDVDDVLKGDDAAHVYRILQEALHNLVKHSEAGHASVQLERDVRCVRLRVDDDGRGFDPAAPGRGIGLTSMAERAHLLGGRLVVESEPGRGTRVHMELPLTDSPDSAVARTNRAVPGTSGT